MKKAILALSAIAFVAAYAGSASAQVPHCDFDGLAKAKGIKSSMVRLYAGCPSTEHPTINSQTGGSTPSCQPVMPKEQDDIASGYLFDPVKGGCDVQTKGKIEADCAELTDANGDPLGVPSGPCHVTYVKSKCKGILQADGVTPINANEDAGWSLATLTRTTYNDATNGDMTVIDFPVTFSYQDPDNGKMKLDSNSAQALAEFVGPASAGLPTCSTLQTIKITIKDPAGLPFATMGGSTRAKDE